MPQYIYIYIYIYITLQRTIHQNPRNMLLQISLLNFTTNTRYTRTSTNTN